MAYWVRTRLEKTSNEQPDYSRLRAHLLDKPRTKAGQVRQAWPEIKKLIAAEPVKSLGGKSLRWAGQLLTQSSES
jgi:hypothetical protein